MPSLHQIFGHAVRRFRIEAGYSQESFADAIGVHRNYIGTVERGETNITLDNISRIARGLKQPIWVLLKEMESTSGSSAAPLEHARAKTLPESSTPSLPARVAERRGEVHNQIASLVEELRRIETVSAQSRKKVRRRKPKE